MQKEVDNKVTAYFKQNNIDLKPLFTGKDTSTVQKAAEALGVQDGQIAKSLAMNLKDRHIVLVTEGTARLDNRKFKDTFECKAKMMSAEETLEITGYPVGGVCPFALGGDIKIYLDESLKKYSEVYPAAGTRDSAVCVTVEKLAQYTSGEWVDVCKKAEQ